MKATTARNYRAEFERVVSLNQRRFLGDEFVDDRRFDEAVAAETDVEIAPAADANHNSSKSLMQRLICCES